MTRKYYVLAVFSTWVLISLTTQAITENENLFLEQAVSSFVFIILSIPFLSFLSGLRFGKRAIIVGAKVAFMVLSAISFGYLYTISSKHGLTYESNGFIVVMVGWVSINLISAITNLTFAGSLIKSRGLTPKSISVLAIFVAVDAFIFVPNGPFEEFRLLTNLIVILLVPVILIHASGLIGKLSKKRQLPA